MARPYPLLMDTWLTPIRLVTWTGEALWPLTVPIPSAPTPLAPQVSNVPSERTAALTKMPENLRDTRQCELLRAAVAVVRSVADLARAVVAPGPHRRASACDRQGRETAARNLRDRCQARHRRGSGGKSPRRAITKRTGTVVAPGEEGPVRSAGRACVHRRPIFW